MCDQTVTPTVGLSVRGYDSDHKDMKTGGTKSKNHWVRFRYHKLTTLATYNERFLSSKNRLQELEELERINGDIQGL